LHILSDGGTLTEVEEELAATACGTLSESITATVNRAVCNCIDDPCITDVCPCNGDENIITLSTSGYTEGDNEQWYIVVSEDGIVTTQMASGTGSVLFSGLPDGNHQIYAVNYDPNTDPDVIAALADGNSWSDFIAGITDGSFCAAYIGPQDISINDVSCGCDTDCIANAGEVAVLDPSGYCDNDDTTLALSVSGNQTAPDYGTLLIITYDNPLTGDVYDIIGIAEATSAGSGMYNLGTGSDGYYNVLDLDPGEYCVHSVNYALADFSPSTELQILNEASGFISSIDALSALSAGICVDVTTTACQALSIYNEISFDASANCDPDDLDNFSISISNISGGSGSDIVVGSSDGSIADNGDGTYTVSGIANDTAVTLSIGDDVCSTTVEVTGNCLDVDCPAEATADASNQAACDGEAIALSVNNVIGASGIATSDYTISWASSDASIDTSDPANVVVNNSDCAAKEVMLTATLVCLDGATTISADINVTIYPSSLDAFISATGDGCDPRIEVDANCSDVILVGSRSPASIPPDQSGNASWEISYIFQGNNTPLPSACNLNQSFESAYSCAPVCPTPLPFIFEDLAVCAGSPFNIPILGPYITTANDTGNLYADIAWTTSDGSFSSNSDSGESVTLENTNCVPAVVTFNFEITCSLDGSTVRSGSFDVTVYPTDISSFVTLDESDGCSVSLLPNEGCELYIAGDVYVAGPGASGTESLTASYIGSDCAVDYSADANYDCDDVISCDAGTISGGSVTFVCDQQNAIVQTTEASGVITYVVHDGDDTTIGTEYASSEAGLFTNDGGIPLNVELCITAIATSNDPLEDFCYDISNCARVVFLSPINIDVNENCDSSTGDITVSVIITGGAPEYLPQVHSYDISGSITGTGTSGDTFEIGPLAVGEEYSIFIDEDGKGCSEAYVNVTGECDIYITCDGGTIDAGSNFLCDGEFSIFTASGVVGTNTYYVHDGDNSTLGTVYASSSTGQFINDGAIPLNVELCVTSVAESSDPSGTCIDLSNCASVVFLSPISVDFPQTCNEATGIVSVDYVITGGAPEYLPGVHFYNITGPNGLSNSAAEAGVTYSYGDVAPNTDYSLTLIDDGKGCEGEYNFTSIPCEMGMEPMPSISLEKTADDSGVTVPALPGQVIFYSFVVCNTGDTDLTNVTVSDVLGPVTGGPISLAIDECDETSFTASYTITAEDIAAGQVINSATVSGTSPGGEKVSDSDEEIVPLIIGMCNNDAGIMPSDLMNVCYGGYANVTTSDASIDSGSSLTYILHNGDGADIGDILDYNATGLFLNDGSYPYNTELHICAVAAPTTGGLPDFDAECIDISDNCTPVVFLSEIIIDAIVECFPGGRFEVTFEISGGMPSAYSSSQYTVSGDYSGLVSTGTATVIGPFDVGSLYAFYATDENNCSASNTSLSIVCEKLPIDLISYTGKVQAQGNMLKWVTATETENAYYTLEHSTDGYSFKKVAIIDGAGTVSEPQSYNYLHRDAPAGISYYKLWQTDYDGTKTYVGIVGLTRGEVTLNITSIQPIPVLEYMELVYTSISETQAQLQIFDAVGRSTIDMIIQSNIGINNKTIDVSSFTPGIYFLTISQGDDVVTQKFIKE